MRIMKVEQIPLTYGGKAKFMIQNVLPATIIGLDSPVGQPFVLVSLRCGEARMLARITRRALESLGLTLGQTVHIQIKSVAMVA